MKYTINDIIHILQEDYKQRTVLDIEIEEGLNITADTLLLEWRETCNLQEWEKLSRYFNEWFGMDISWPFWKERVFPEREKTIKDLASLISAYAEKPVYTPVRLLGQECLSAGIPAPYQKISK